MTDKTPENKAEIPVNTPTTLAVTTDATRNSESKNNRALPQADALKARFKAGSIPLQTDFADLIDLANIGRQAVGDESTGFGLVKDDKNRLRYDPREIFNFAHDLSPSNNNERKVLDFAVTKDIKEHSRFAFLTLSSANGPDIATAALAGNSTTYTVNAVKIDANGNRVYTPVKIIAYKAVGFTGNYVPFEYVQDIDAKYSLWYTFELDTTGNDFNNCTLVIDPLTLVVKHISDYSSSPLDGEIISLITFHFVYHGFIVGDGLQVNNMKIAAKVDGSKGLEVNTSGISVKTGNGIAVNSSGVNIKLAANSGLSTDEMDGLKIAPEQMFQKGMIMMFSGSEADMPEGWGLCDGTKGRPDLQGRFILGSVGFSDINKTNDKKVQGNYYNKEFIVSSDSKKSEITVVSKGHALTVNEMPSHSHDIFTTDEHAIGHTVGGKIGGDNSVIQRTLDGERVIAKKTGGGYEHNHDINVEQKEHHHDVNVVPPYYILAFIIKL